MKLRFAPLLLVGLSLKGESHQNSWPVPVFAAQGPPKTENGFTGQIRPRHVRSLFLQVCVCGWILWA